MGRMMLHGGDHATPAPLLRGNLLAYVKSLWRTALVAVETAVTFVGNSETSVELGEGSVTQHLAILSPDTGSHKANVNL